MPEIISDGVSPNFPGSRILTYQINATTYLSVMSLITTADDDPEKTEYMVWTKVGDTIVKLHGQASGRTYWYVHGSSGRKKFVIGLNAVNDVFDRIRRDPTTTALCEVL